MFKNLFGSTGALSGTKNADGSSKLTNTLTDVAGILGQFFGSKTATQNGTATNPIVPTGTGQTFVEKVATAAGLGVGAGAAKNLDVKSIIKPIVTVLVVIAVVVTGFIFFTRKRK